MMTTEMPEISLTSRFNMRQAAKILGVHPSTIRRWVDAQKLEPVDLLHSDRIKFTGAELLRFWKRH